MDATLVIYFILRDRKKTHLFFGKHHRISALIIIILAAGILIALYSTVIEPFCLRINAVQVNTKKISKPIKIAFVSDIQIGRYKKDWWSKKIVKKIESINPDLVIFGGDQIDNEGTFIDESVYLEPLKTITDKYPSYYIMGNHEYGIGGSVRFMPQKYTADLSELLIKRMAALDITLLRNNLECLNIKNQEICLFGIDEIWKHPPNFSQIEGLNKNTSLIIISHNPDGILYYQDYLPKPDLVLAGHTHGGQVWIPFLGPLGNAQIELPNQYYRGLNIYKEIPIYTSVGAGESGAPLRFFAMPEIAIIELTP